MVGSLSNHKVGRSGHFLVVVRCREGRLHRVASNIGRHRSAVSVVIGILDLILIGHAVSTVGFAGRNRLLSRFAIRPAFDANGCRTIGLGNGHIDRIAGFGAATIIHLNPIRTAVRHIGQLKSTFVVADLLIGTQFQCSVFIGVLIPNIAPAAVHGRSRQRNCFAIGNGAFRIRSQRNGICHRPLGIVGIARHRCRNSSTRIGRCLIPCSTVTCTIYSIKACFRCIYASAIDNKDNALCIVKAGTITSKCLSRRRILRIDYTLFIELVRLSFDSFIAFTGIIPKATRTDCESTYSREIQPVQFGATQEHLFLEHYGLSGKLCRLQIGIRTKGSFCLCRCSNICGNGQMLDRRFSGKLIATNVPTISIDDQIFKSGWQFISRPCVFAVDCQSLQRSQCRKIQCVHCTVDFNALYRSLLIVLAAI